MLQAYQKIMVAIDGSAESEIAFKKAANVAKRNQAYLLLAHVLDTRAFQNVSNFDTTLMEQAQTVAESTLNDYAQKAKELGIANVESVIEYGSPKNILAKQLPIEHGVDLILLGATGLNAVERLFVGSVSEYVIRQAPCDVLVVRTDLDNKTASFS